jgi:membrane-bound ClpP family serine protease
MTPGTNIGAAHLMDMGGQKMWATLEDKLTNDAVAYLQAIVQQRGRNADWAEKAVRQSAFLIASQPAILRSKVFSLALEKVYNVASTIGDKTMSLQYLETMKALGPATKSVLSMEFINLLRPFLGHTELAINREKTTEW